MQNILDFASTVFATVSEQLKEITANIGVSIISTLASDALIKIASVGTAEHIQAAAEFFCMIVLFVLLLVQKTIEDVSSQLKCRTPTISADSNNSGNNFIMEVDFCLPAQQYAENNSVNSAKICIQKARALVCPRFLLSFYLSSSSSSISASISFLSARSSVSVMVIPLPIFS